MDLSLLNTTDVPPVPCHLTSPVDHPQCPLGSLLFDQDADGNAVPTQILLASPDSVEVNGAKKKLVDRKLAKATVRGLKTQLTADGLESDGIDILVAATRGWTGIRVKGVLLPCSPEAARNLYLTSPWIREQVESFVSDRTNFLKN